MRIQKRLIKMDLPKVQKTLDDNKGKTSVYFAHPFDTRDTKREEMVIKHLKKSGYCVINPFDYEDELCEKHGVDNYYDKPCKDLAVEMVSRDFKEVEMCDELFAWIPNSSSSMGTLFEIAYAYELGKKVTVFVERAHPFLLFYADIMYISYSDFKKDKPYEWIEE